jgi:uncharacterized protein YbjT (DUF2867 family)
MCAISVRHAGAERATIEFGGPEALTPIEVVRRFERIGGRPFRVEHVPQEALRAQYEAATDPLQKTFAGLMLNYSMGDAMQMAPVVEKYGLRLASVDDYASRVMAKSQTA